MPRFQCRITNYHPPSLSSSSTTATTTLPYPRPSPLKPHRIYPPLAISNCIASRPKLELKQKTRQTPPFPTGPIPIDTINTAPARPET
ncbi:hypothetical protein P167DRAFT_538411 [Morchella conica CCBAS932]|uniref:Uncharacterized protein n=1 Tax=Morchella conica CCBAS932 TaxID=1392247 RepID=A0A3N4KG93_9PEZI|nr:hypothetical protein P167DRAFT_538411 [Morchella conica CCBAS932]